jgi:hypothetical protein
MERLPIGMRLEGLFLPQQSKMSGDSGVGFEGFGQDALNRKGNGLCVYKFSGDSAERARLGREKGMG